MKHSIARKDQLQHIRNPIRFFLFWYSSLVCCYYTLLSDVRSLAKQEIHIHTMQWPPSYNLLPSTAFHPSSLHLTPFPPPSHLLPPPHPRPSTPPFLLISPHPLTFSANFKTISEKGQLSSSCTAEELFPRTLPKQDASADRIIPLQGHEGSQNSPPSSFRAVISP